MTPDQPEKPRPASVTQLPGTKPAGPDWAAIRLAYEGSTRTERQLATEFRVSRSTLNARAKAEGWARDTELLVARRTAQKLRERAHGEAIAAAPQGGRRVSLIDAAADVLANVLTRHQAGTHEGYGVAMQLLAGLREQLAHRPRLEALMDLARDKLDRVGVSQEAAGEDDQLGELVSQVREFVRTAGDIRDALEALPLQARTLKAIAESQVRWISLERQSHGMVDPREPPKPPPPMPDPNLDADAAYRWMLERDRQRPPPPTPPPAAAEIS